VRPCAAAPFSEELRRYWLMHGATQAARLSVLILLVANAITAPAQVTLPAANSRPNGLVVVIENKPLESGLNLRALNNPSISGVALQIRWRDIEPVEGRPDWTKLDQLFAAAESRGKWVQLLIFRGFICPAWALKGVQTESFSIQYGPGKGTSQPLPLPWEEVYLNRWFAFVKLLSGRYGNSPAFRVIAAAGPTSVSAEYTLPATPEDVRIWQSAHYTPSKYRAAWRKTFREYAADFPHQYVSISLGFGLNINDREQIDPSERLRTRQAIIDEGMDALGRRFVLQFSNLDGVQGAGPGSRAVDFVLGFNGRAMTGMQLRTSCERNSGDMGAEGNPALAL